MVGVGDGLHDGQAQACATLVSLRPGGPAGETVEDVAGVVGGQAGAGVGDPQAQQPAGAIRARPGAVGAGDPAADADRRPLVRVIHRVGGDLEHRLHDPLGVDHRRGFGDFLDQPLPVAEGLRLRFEFQGQVGDVGFGGHDEVGAFGAGESEQLGDDARHAVELRRRQADGALAFLAGRALEQFELPADDGDRGAQFMAGVVDEAALRGVRRFQPVEHPVEGQREFGDVVAAGHGHPLRQVGVLDAGGDAADLAHGRENLPGYHPRDEQRQQQAADGHAGDDPDLVVHAFAGFGSECGDDQVVGVGPAGQRDAPPVDAPVIPGFEDAGGRVGFADGPQQFAVGDEPLGAQSLGSGAAFDLDDLVADDAGDDLVVLGDLPRQEHLEQPGRRVERFARGGVDALDGEAPEFLGLLLDLRVRAGLDFGEHDRARRQDDREQHDAQQHHDPRDNPPPRREPRPHQGLRTGCRGVGGGFPFPVARVRPLADACRRGFPPRHQSSSQSSS